MLVAKAEAGAEFAVTQMFFRASDYFELVERVRARGVDIPILPGIMPILNLNAIRRQGELIGTDVPADLVERISVHEGDPAAMRAEGIAIAAELCEELLDGRRARAALLHAEPLQGDAGDLRRAQHDRLTATSVSRVRTLTVTGTGSAAAVPDTALVRLSAVHRARSLAEALAGAESAAGRGGRRPPATWWSRPSTCRSGRPRAGQPAGFEARHTLTIATGDLATANELLSDAGRRGRRPAAWSRASS